MWQKNFKFGVMLFIGLHWLLFLILYIYDFFVANPAVPHEVYQYGANHPGYLSKIIGTSIVELFLLVVLFYPFSNRKPGQNAVLSLMIFSVWAFVFTVANFMHTPSVYAWHVFYLWTLWAILLCIAVTHLLKYFTRMERKRD